MQRHAYLILTHGDFEVLTQLVNQLDDSLNDIFIHFDKKVKIRPQLCTKKSQLHIVNDSADVRWGHSSMLRAEFYLFESALSSNISYHFYHLISGTHYPLLSQKDIHMYYRDKHKNVLSKMETSSREIDLKLNFHNLFIKNFNHKRPHLKSFYQLLWHIGIKVQQCLGIRREPIDRAIKASQWLSLNHHSVKYLVTQKDRILNRYQRTLCADEFFIPSTLTSSGSDFDIMYVDDLLFCEFEGPNPKVLMPSDISAILSSNCLFARKFSDHNIQTIRELNLVKGSTL